jgi:beta-N-acetylhexosaminidase
MRVIDEMRKKPFSLDDEQIDWVLKTFHSLDLKGKVGQLFCLAARSTEREWVNGVFDTCEPAGFMYRPMTLKDTLDYTKVLNEKAKIPLLIAADVEKGGNGVISDYGTLIGSPMAIAATGDVENARRLGTICAAETAAVGGNWAFAPIIDIDYNYRNPITNIRTFGSDPKAVKEFGKAYVEEVQRLGVAASIKHFPGDGRDERDQHLVTTINDLDCDEWMETYGEAYKASIEAGAMAVMIGHIMLPALQRKLRPEQKDDEMMPATLAPELMNDLLREILGFKGLIVTDATTMVGFNCVMPRRKSVPLSIASGADMFLFPKNLTEDFQFMMEGVMNGVITQERLDEAVLRVIGFKAALRLYEKKVPSFEEAIKVVGCDQHKKWAKECADQSITIVKEQEGVLPISVEKYPRVLVYPIEKDQGNASFDKNGASAMLIHKLEEKGFNVSIFEPWQGAEGRLAPTTNIVGKYDLIIYVANIPTKSNQTTVRIEWATPIGSNCPIYFNDIPTIFISLENPYHLLDAPRVKTYINTYCATPETIESVIDKLMGISEFKGISPSDPFCGKWDTRL